MTTNKWLGVVVVILAVLIAANLRLTSATTDLTEQVARMMRHVEPPGSVRGLDIGVDTTRPYRGNPTAPVHMIVFSDFQCPACAHLAPVISALADRYGDSLCISYRNNPLSAHHRARELAILGQMAWHNGKFWNFHDSLFADQGQLDDVILSRLCQSVGISPQMDENLGHMIDADLRLAEQLEVKATPTIFVNGRRITGAYPLSVFERIVSEELTAPNQRPMLCEN